MSLATGGAASLVDAFQAAPFEQGGWDAALKSLATQAGSARAQLVAFGGPKAIAFNWITDPDPRLVEEISVADTCNPNVNWRMACAARPMELVRERHYAAARSRLKSDLYDEFVDRLDLPYGCQTVLCSTSEAFYGLAMLRSRSDGRTSDDELDVFARTAPHVLSAIRTQMALEHQGAELIAGALDALDSAAFVCDRDGNVQGFTRAAEAWLSEQSGLRLVGKRLVCDRPQENRVLNDALRLVLDDTVPLPAPIQLWFRPSTNAFGAHSCEVLPLPKRNWSFGFEPKAIVIVRPPAEIEERRLPQIRDLLGLTQAEAEVAVLIADGISREEISKRRGSSMNTVSSQLKSVFAKADVTREAQLAALINRLMR